MGTDIYAYGFVGIPIESSALLVDQVDAHETCSKGHVRQEGTGAFCDQDGGKFEHRTQRIPTEGFWKLCVHLNLDKADVHACKRLIETGYIWQSASYRGVGRGEPLMLLTTGDRLITGSHRDRKMTGPVSWNEAEIGRQFEKVRELARILGIAGEGRFYLQQELS